MKISVNILSIFLALLLLFNGVSATLTYAYYNIDPIGFIEALCENQDTPELQCNGQCHLKKVAKSQENDTPEGVVNFKEIILFSAKQETFVFYKKEYINKQNLTVYQNLYSFSDINDCFHPPQV